MIDERKILPLMNTKLTYPISNEENQFMIIKPQPPLKRVFDLSFAIILFIVLLPLFLLFSIIVKVDGGSAFYGHERVGKNGQKFKCLKFRSMASNSQELLQNLLASDPISYEEWHSTYKLKNDPRVTRIGHFLRKSSLDEMPQLINIIKGEMSFVGPRPVTQDELTRYKDNVIYYLAVTPGLTGLWQVSGRNDIDYETRVSLDTQYVKNWSFSQDLKILAKTFIIVILGKGAY
ncbi:undecaprenyl-phosphate galactose phosphotransferase [Acinetobacter junii SH205]|uniref:Undecaprenyl-phosphate galactose phosphotransferase n=1 Tax=Acinetobacter junii SH205 TaxID=575587 RepID=D0SR02_ACIJU|nr:sugar transferase [Acinetobacter junii]EEY91617.1 undecaprenyl-phosphate galactose phosphotransferase [Acinetobacter junii SH205]